MATNLQTQTTKDHLIFTSYSHLDEGWKNRLLPHIRMLMHQSDLEEWNDRHIGLGENWYEEITARLQSCDVAILLISAHFLSSEFCVRKEIPPLLERRRRDGMMIAPVLIRPCNWKRIPWLSALQMFPRDGRSIAKLSVADRDQVFSEINEEISQFLESDKRVHIVHSTKNAPAPLKVNISRLPTSGYDLIGRDEDLRWLDDAYATPDINVASLVAWGGCGKSTLVNKWCEYLAADQYRGAQRVFAWSFYSQGTRERVTSADAFVDEALKFFGDPEPNVGSPWIRGERLASLVGREKSLLILDGMEPLQDQSGGIKDPALAQLLMGLAEKNMGLCVITTRTRAKELANFRNAFKERDLEHLSPEAGRALLRISGVLGTEDELLRASQELNNHAFALVLFAGFVQSIPQHPASTIDRISSLDIPEDQGAQPRRIMASFVAKFGRSPELEALSLIGLFDRPADEGSVTALRTSPTIPGLTKRISKLSEADWLHLCGQLRRVGLFAPASRHAPRELDAHPLVREHFASYLKDNHPTAWRRGHDRLCQHLQMHAKEYPEKLDEMVPLYRAMQHGLHARKYEYVLNELYFRRIQRGNEFFSSRHLGAIGAELAAIAGFFSVHWIEPVPALRKKSSRLVLNQAAWRLLCLGRLAEAIETLHVELGAELSSNDWAQAGWTFNNLGALNLFLGNINRSIDCSERSVFYSEKSGDPIQPKYCLNLLGDALHQSGRFNDALKIFNEIPGEQRDHYHQYWDLLNDLKEHQFVASNIVRHIKNLESRENPSSANVGLLRMVYAQALAANGELAKSLEAIEKAMDELRFSQRHWLLPFGLITYSRVLHLLSKWNEARSTLKQALRIAESGGMRLFLCDIHIEYGRIALAQGNRAEVVEHSNFARDLYEAAGYRRRHQDLIALENNM